MRVSSFSLAKVVCPPQSAAYRPQLHDSVLAAMPWAELDGCDIKRTPYAWGDIAAMLEIVERNLRHLTDGPVNMDAACE